MMYTAYIHSTLNQNDKITRWILVNLFIKQKVTKILPNKKIFLNSSLGIFHQLTEHYKVIIFYK